EDVGRLEEDRLALRRRRLGPRREGGGRGLDGPPCLVRSAGPHLRDDVAGERVEILKRLLRCRNHHLLLSSGSQTTSLSSGAPGIRSRASLSSRTRSRLRRESRACSRAISSARVPCRSRIDSISCQWWCCATTRIWCDCGRTACEARSAPLGIANGS